MPSTLSPRLDHLRLASRDARLGRSVHGAFRQLLAHAAEAGAISLTHANMQAFPPPPGAGERYRDAVAAGVDPFTGFLGDDHIRELLAPRVSRFLGREVGRDEIAITSGTQNALFSVLSLLVADGTKVMLADLEYLSLGKTIPYLGGEIVPLPTAPDEAGALRMSLDDIERGFRAGARLLVFTNPCNPTGTVYDAGFIASVAELALRYDGYVVVDELYSRLVYDGGFEHLAAQPGMRERCITTLGTSKTEGMSGFRLGCLVGPEEIVSAMIDVIEVTALRASTYAQYALVDWLGPDQDWIDDRVAQCRSLRDQAVAALREVPGLEVASPGGTGYMFPRFTGGAIDDFAAAEALVADAGVLVFPGLAFGVGGAGGFRFCFAQSAADFAGILERVVATLSRVSEPGLRQA